MAKDTKAGSLDESSSTSASLGIMSNLNEEESVNAWDRLLLLQTDLLGPREIQWFKENGFAPKGSRVLEVGSASGIHGAYIARAFPEASFLGLEANPAFVKPNDPTHLPNYKNLVCMVAKDSIPTEALGSQQGYLRYVLQHFSDPVKLMKDLHACLAPGARVYVIEGEMDNFIESYSKYGYPFDKVAATVRKVSQGSGTNLAFGDKVGKILEDSGFRVDKVEKIPRGPETFGTRFLEYLRVLLQMLHASKPTVVTKEIMDELIGALKALESNPPDIKMCYPQVLIAATKI